MQLHNLVQEGCRGLQALLGKHLAGGGLQLPMRLHSANSSTGVCMHLPYMAASCDAMDKGMLSLQAEICCRNAS